MLALVCVCIGGWGGRVSLSICGCVGGRSGGGGRLCVCVCVCVCWWGLSGNMCSFVYACPYVCT